MKPIIMGLFATHGPRGWDNPGLQAGYDWRQPDVWQDLALIGERGVMDLIIFADNLGISEAFRGSQETPIRYGLEGVNHDPVPLIAMIAAKAQKIGVAATVSTTFVPPFALARQMSTLDHLTRGRVGWNVVTSITANAGKNFGVPLPPHDERYDLAEEYMELCYRLWGSWEPDALVTPRKGAVFANPAKVHRVDYQSAHYKSQGPLTNVHSPQTRPVIIQAGTSERGREFAARHAELVICSKESLDDMKATRDDIKERAVRFGRKESDVRVLFTFRPIVRGLTEEVVQRTQRLFDDASAGLVEVGLSKLSFGLGMDMSKFDLDKPLSPVDINALQGVRSLLSRYYSHGSNPTLREVAAREATKETFHVRGTYERIAERLMEVTDRIDGDGFLLRAIYLGDSVSGYISEFVDHVVPILQREGYMKTTYPEGALRDRLGTRYNDDLSFVRPKRQQA